MHSKALLLKFIDDIIKKLISEEKAEKEFMLVCFKKALPSTFYGIWLSSSTQLNLELVKRKRTKCKPNGKRERSHTRLPISTSRQTNPVSTINSIVKKVWVKLVLPLPYSDFGLHSAVSSPSLSSFLEGKRDQWPSTSFSARFRTINGRGTSIFFLLFGTWTNAIVRMI